MLVVTKGYHARRTAARVTDDVPAARRYHRTVPRIHHYRFGRIVVDGVAHTADVILLPDRVIAPWWRKAGGHVFAPADLGPVLDAAPEAVVLGTGHDGRVRVPRDTLEALRTTGAEVVVVPTGQAVEEYERRRTAGERVAAALHLTC